MSREEYEAAAAHLDLPDGDPTGGCCDEAGGAIRGYVGELERDVERLRGRTHEIQAQEMAKRASLDSLVALLRARWDAAKQWTEVEGLTADWALKPGSPFWPMTSMNNRDALARLIGERDDAHAEVERLRNLLDGVGTFDPAVDR